MVEAIKEVSKSIVDVSQPGYLDYVQIVISIISVVVSGVAIWFAISVPKKIAENQNRISLFEKRFEFYDQLCLCISFSRMIKNIQTHEEIVKFFIATFGRELAKDTSEEGLRREHVRLQWNAMVALKQGTFLFDFETKGWIDPLISKLVIILTVEETHHSFWDYYSEYMDAVKAVEKDLLPKVEAALKISEFVSKK